MSALYDANTVIITEVSPRDGLQNQQPPLSTEDKKRLIHLLLDAGVCHIEAASFVSPKAVPQMADADQLFTLLSKKAVNHCSALVPNMKGLVRARAAEVPEIAVVLSATETMNQKNINMSLEQASLVSEQTLIEAKSLGLRARAYIAVAVECPFEGAVDKGVVANLAQRMKQAGADEIVIADTIGAAVPAQLKEVLRSVLTVIQLEDLAVHLHDTRGMGVANAWAAMELGIRRFDASVGGLGGCPFAPGAAGNLATEDLVLLAEQSGLHTGIDLPRLYMVIEYLEHVLGRQLGGQSSAWYRQQLRRHESRRDHES